MHPHRLSCREIVELVTEYLEDALRPEQDLLVRLHLDRCQGCQSYLEQMRCTIRLLRSLAEPAPTPERAAQTPLLDRLFGAPPRSVAHAWSRQRP